MSVKLSGLTLSGGLRMSVPVTDPYAGSIVFLANFDNNFNNSIDNAAPHEIIGATRVAGAGKDGSTAVVFDMGANSRVSYYPNNVAIDAQTPFTVEMFAKMSQGAMMIFTNFFTSSNLTAAGMSLTSSRVSMHTDGGGSTYDNFPGMSLNQWHHIAITHPANSTLTQVWVDGVITGTLNSTWATPITPRWIFGGLGAINWTAPFTLDSARITGAVRYTANFTPPTSF